VPAIVPSPEYSLTVALEVNGSPVKVSVEARAVLADVLRDELGLLGTRLGCREGQCGACTVLVDGATARSCIVLAAQVDGAAIRTVEGLAEGGALSPIQQAFADEHALQCGFCTAGMMLSVEELLRDSPQASDDQIRAALGGNLCRCTGYQGILRAVQRLRGT
jgi:aerobic-type carbon monoxide dehydrogenase small subunit (CoxS/CutS family)